MLEIQRITQKVVAGLPLHILVLNKFAPKIIIEKGIGALLNNSLKQDLRIENLHFLSGKNIAIKVIDIDFYSVISLQRNRFVVNLDKAGKVDVVISANFYDYLRLITGSVDPDTLFFRRRLTILGDTDLALNLKNFLDTLTVHEHLPYQLCVLLKKLTHLSEQPTSTQQ